MADQKQSKLPGSLIRQELDIQDWKNNPQSYQKFANPVKWQQYLPSDFAIAGMVRIVSYDLDGLKDADVKSMVDVLQQCNADIILLQDPRPAAPSSGGTKATTNQLQSLQAQLLEIDDYNFTVAASSENMAILIRRPWIEVGKRKKKKKKSGQAKVKFPVIEGVLEQVVEVHVAGKYYVKLVHICMPDKLELTADQHILVYKWVESLKTKENTTPVIVAGNMNAVLSAYEDIRPLGKKPGKKPAAAIPDDWPKIPANTWDAMLWRNAWVSVFEKGNHAGLTGPALELRPQFTASSGRVTDHMFVSYDESQPNSAKQWLPYTAWVVPVGKANHLPIGMDLALVDEWLALKTERTFQPSAVLMDFSGTQGVVIQQAPSKIAGVTDKDWVLVSTSADSVYVIPSRAGTKTQAHTGPSDDWASLRMPECVRKYSVVFQGLASEQSWIARIWERRLQEIQRLRKLNTTTHHTWEEAIVTEVGPCVKFTPLMGLAALVETIPAGWRDSRNPVWPRLLCMGLWQDSLMGSVLIGQPPQVKQITSSKPNAAATLAFLSELIRCAVEGLDLCTLAATADDQKKVWLLEWDDECPRIDMYRTNPVSVQCIIIAADDAKKQSRTLEGYAEGADPKTKAAIITRISQHFLVLTPGLFLVNRHGNGVKPLDLLAAFRELAQKPMSAFNATDWHLLHQTLAQQLVAGDDSKSTTKNRSLLAGLPTRSLPPDRMLVERFYKTAAAVHRRPPLDDAAILSLFRIVQTAWHIQAVRRGLPSFLARDWTKVEEQPDTWPWKKPDGKMATSSPPAAPFPVAEALRVFCDPVGHGSGSAGGSSSRIVRDMLFVRVIWPLLSWYETDPLMTFWLLARYAILATERVVDELGRDTVAEDEKRAGLLKAGVGQPSVVREIYTPLFGPPNAVAAMAKWSEGVLKSNNRALNLSVQEPKDNQLRLFLHNNNLHCLRRLQIARPEWSDDINRLIERQMDELAELRLRAMMCNKLPVGFQSTRLQTWFGGHVVIRELLMGDNKNGWDALIQYPEAFATFLEPALFDANSKTFKWPDNLGSGSSSSSGDRPLTLMNEYNLRWQIRVPEQDHVQFFAP